MFVQVLQGRTTDAEAVHAALDGWTSDVVPGAEGYLGSTTGVTEDGTVISVARYESAQAARANGDRPEFRQWWSATSQLFVDPPTVRAADDVFTNLVGDPDTAGFVQVMFGPVTDPERARQLMEEHVSTLNAMRPDILGRLIATFDDGHYLQVCYFVSEEAARRGESAMTPPPELITAFTEMQQLAGRPDYLDLKEPWLTSA